MKTRILPLTLVGICLLASIVGCEKQGLLRRTEDVLVRAELNDTTYERKTMTYSGWGNHWPSKFEEYNNQYIFTFRTILLQNEKEVHLRIQVINNEPFIVNKDYTLSIPASGVSYHYVTNKEVVGEVLYQNIKVKRYVATDGKLFFSKITDQGKNAYVCGTFDFTGVCQETGEVINVSNGTFENIRTRYL